MTSSKSQAVGAKRAKAPGTGRHQGARSAPRKAIPVRVQLQLWIRAGGRCEFFGCNEDLYRDGLTLSETNYSNIAHIVGRVHESPRGADPMSIAERDQFHNLMLACRKHHALIDSDDYVAEYPKERLLAFKAQHEERVRRLLDVQPTHKTSLIRLRAPIGGQAVAIPLAAMREAIAPRYPVDDKGIEIDLTQVRDRNDPSFWKTTSLAITEKLRDLHSSGVSGPAIEHVSVFAMAPIPLLIHLGCCLTNKIPTDLYQRHRDTEDWKWKLAGESINYGIVHRQEGSDATRVGIILSLSGAIPLERMPQDIRDTCNIYEVTLEGRELSPVFLRTREDLERFISVYHVLIGRILHEVPGVSELHLFPAVPAPIAIACGRELLSKVHPPVFVYDFDRANTEFQFALKVNER